MEAGELHYMFRKVNRLFNKKLYTEFAKLGLTQGQPRILKYLSEHADCIQKDISEYFNLEPATITNTLAVMEHSGLIRREKDSSDQRNVHVFITEEGVLANNRVEERLIMMENECCKGISHEGKEQLAHYFEIIHNNLLKA